MDWWTFVCVFVFFLVNTLAEEWLEVNIDQGPVRGRKDSGGHFYGFYNIPYATAPKNEERYKAPLPPPTWSEPYIAEDKSVTCPQYLYAMPKSLAMQEDCLITNLYVPDTEDKNLSVLVYVHGGAFQIGNGDLFKPKKLMETKDMIMVTFNYRLGVHGFLCLGTDDVPGNAGMKDQVALLRWVQKNIASFGGNPNDVTLAGYSAGSAAVDLLMIAKSAEGLFHKVIPESGANLAAFTVQPDPLRSAKEFAAQLNFTDVDDIFALEKFYKTASYEIITSDWFFERPDSTFLFSPCVEREEEGAFLTRSPLSILKEGKHVKVPLLYGFADMEGLIRGGVIFDVWSKKMNEKFSDFLPADLMFKDEDEKEKVAEEIKQFFFGNQIIGPDTVTAYIDYFSDVIFAYPTLRAVKLHAEAGHKQVYLYEYSYSEETTPVGQYASVNGATHCAQTLAIFDGLNMTHPDESGLSKNLLSMKKLIRNIWHNFVKTGKPVPEGSDLPAWPAAGVDRSPHMSLKLPPQLLGALLPERARFWDHIYDTYYREPIPPPTPPVKHSEL